MTDQEQTAGEKNIRWELRDETISETVKVPPEASRPVLQDARPEYRGAQLPPSKLFDTGSVPSSGSEPDNQERGGMDGIHLFHEKREAAKEEEDNPEGADFRTVPKARESQPTNRCFCSKLLSCFRG